VVNSHVKTPLIFVFFVTSAPAALGQQDEDAAAPETKTVVAPGVEETGPEDALNRGTPRGSAIGFLEACARPDFERAAEYLDLRNLPEEVAEIGGRELARQLNHVLSRTVWLDDYNVSNNPEGTKGDGLPEFRDELVVIRTADERKFPIWLQRVPRGDGELIWKVSNRSAVLIKVHSFLKTTDFTESLEIGEDLILKIMEIVESLGVRFALPGRSLYLEGGRGQPRSGSALIDHDLNAYNVYYVKYNVFPR